MKGGGLPRVVGGNTHTFHPCERTLLVLPIWPIYPINSLPLGGVVGLSTPGNFAIYSAQMISSPLEGNVSIKICQFSKLIHLFAYFYRALCLITLTQSIALAIWAYLPLESKRKGTNHQKH